jgi:hypothetical protein
MTKRKEQIIATVEDLVMSFIYYDRKEDQDLERGEIEAAIDDKEITIDEIVSRFRQELSSGYIKYRSKKEIAEHNDLMTSNGYATNEN